MWLRLNYLQRSHPVRAVHVEPEAQVTHANTGWECTPGRHPGNVSLPLRGWVYVQEVPSTTFGNTAQNTFVVHSCKAWVILQCDKWQNLCSERISTAKPFSTIRFQLYCRQGIIFLTNIHMIFGQKKVFLLLWNVVACSLKLQRAS